MLKDGISVTICCYNSGWIIKRCLQALKAQIVREGLSWEIILVDNNCTDNTVTEALSAMEESDIDFRIVNEPTPGLLNARKKGISKVQYAYTIYCDDDNLLCPKYVDTMYGILASNTQIGAAGGKGIAEFETEPDPRILKYIEGYAVGSQLEHKDFLFGAGLAVRTAVVREIYSTQKMYLTGRLGNKLLAGDDTELTMAILLRGYRLYPTDDISYIHILKANRLSWDYFQKLNFGFKHSSPAIMVMRGVLMNKSFYHACVTNYIMAIFVFTQHMFLFWKGTASDVRRKNIKTISIYHAWGFATLKSIYNQWIKIKKDSMFNHKVLL